MNRKMPGNREAKDLVESLALHARHTFMKAAEIHPSSMATVILPESSLTRLARGKWPYRGVLPDDSRDAILSAALDAVYTRSVLLVQLEDVRLPDHVRSLFATTDGQWIFSNRCSVKQSSTSPFFLWADGDTSAEKCSYVQHELGFIQTLLKYAAHPLTPEASFAAITRHFPFSK
jgi:hypothetical protein